MSHATRTRGLIIVTVLLTAVIGLGLLPYNANELDYEISTTEAVDVLGHSLTFLSLEKARELQAKAATDHVFIDLRSPDLFSKGHLKEAVNIPLHRLLEPAVVERFQDPTFTYVLYGEDIAEGAAACALLQQVGLTNVQALQGGYRTYSSGQPSPLAEAAQYDYQAVFERVGVEERGNLMAPPAEAPKKLILPTKRVAKPVSEGC